ncbi:MAG: 3-deoxy-D-manno-octulosonic acid transferase [Gammaproteobacteria bacterium]|nr:3-deoxy-D-manno-octulosonic acid transferase [Gammaproteobacteria bacterium]MYF66383.1 3-deoxy-D-manno-octulosonic acid transferase [Gammaproteobacteria bacterium]MYK37254.1 3-deoxy-D-manno-octulosonic acid transferase [Gammaproteobacteria bacterium]
MRAAQERMNVREKAVLGAYGALSWIAAPAMCGYMLARSARDPGWRRRLSERWTVRTPQLPAGGVWLHGSSLGETGALSVVAGEMRARRPDLPMLLTAFTPAGSAAIQGRLRESQSHCFLPLDLGVVNRRFLRAARPALGVILETEIWPGLYAACRSAGVPLVIVSARLSERSHARYRRVRGLVSAALRAVRVVGAQSEEDAQRFAELGPDGLDVRVTGNLKFHFRPEAGVLERGAEIRRSIGRERPVWIAASTHEPEENVALDAHRQVLAGREDALLIIAPRHRERFAAVHALLKQSGLDFGVRSGDGSPPPGAQVFLLDTLGEMNAFYAAADVAFVGGSIARVGGHNLLEPAAFGLPVLTGPHLFQTRDTARLLSEAGALFRVHDARELAGRLARLLDSELAQRSAGEAARNCLAAGEDVLEETLGLIEPLLPPRPAPSSG